MQKKQRGGKRLNAGRKPEGEEALSETIIARVTPDQKVVFREKGGSKWLRMALSPLAPQLKDLPSWIKKGCTSDKPICFRCLSILYRPVSHHLQKAIRKHLILMNF